MRSRYRYFLCTRVYMRVSCAYLCMCVYVAVCCICVHLSPPPNSPVSPILSSLVPPEYHPRYLFNVHLLPISRLLCHSSPSLSPPSYLSRPLSFSVACLLLISRPPHPFSPYLFPIVCFSPSVISVELHIFYQVFKWPFSLKHHFKLSVLFP